MSDTVTNIRSALVQAFVTGAFFLQADIEYENVAFEAPVGKPWCKFHFVPSQPEVGSLGAGGSDDQRGFVQIDLNYPAGSGEKEVGDKFEAIRNVFKAGVRFAYSETEVVILSCGRAQGRNVGGYYRVPVTIMFYSHVTRP